MPLHIDRNDLVHRAHAQDHVLDRGVRHGGGRTATTKAGSTEPASESAIVDPTVALAVQAASSTDVASVDQAEKLVQLLRANPGALARLHDSLDAGRVQALLAD